MTALLFGSIGTFADTSELQREAFNAAFRKHGLDWTWDRDTYRDMLRTSGGADRIAEQARAQGQDVDAKAIHATKSTLFQEMLAAGRATARPGVHDLLSHARTEGRKVGFVTTTSRDNVDAVLSALDLDPGTFDVVLSREDVQQGKPDPEVFALAAERLGMSPSDCTAIEDNADGARAALAAGMTCIAWPNENTVDHEFGGAHVVKGNILAALHPRCGRRAMSWTAAHCTLDAQAVTQSLGESGVVVIAGAGVTDDAFVTFLEALGPLTFTEGETPLDGQPKLNFVTNVGRRTPPRSVFHTDTSYVAAPPAFTALKAEKIPTSGGETVFTNQFHAFERMSPDLKLRLRGARVLHRATGVADATRTWHPLFRRHPVSGRTALFLSTPERCTDLELADGTRQAALIEALYAHSIDPAHEWRHAWAQGDIVIWDNRCTLHKADHTAVSGDRVLHRGMVAGEVPIAA